MRNPESKGRESIDLPNKLSLTATRLKLELRIFPTKPTTTQPQQLDELKVKEALSNFLKQNPFFINVLDRDINIKRVRNKDDLKKLKRGDPIGFGTLVFRDFSFEGSFEDWRKSVVDKLDALEVNIQAIQFRLAVSLPKGDDFHHMNKDWQHFYQQGYSRSGPREPDTIILRGVPSRWFAEPRVSSKPSLLVTHTIFSTFGKIRHLDVAEDDDPGNADEDTEGLIKGLHCKIVVQFEEHKDFYHALKTFSSRSLQKEGSKLKVDYEITWDKQGFFRNSSIRTQDRSSRMQLTDVQRRSDDTRKQLNNSRYSPDNVRRKRFKE